MIKSFMSKWSPGIMVDYMGEIFGAPSCPAQSASRHKVGSQAPEFHSQLLAHL